MKHILIIPLLSCNFSETGDGLKYSGHKTNTGPEEQQAKEFPMC